MIETGSILLVREIADAGALDDAWQVGRRNQSPSECVIRELREETGLEVAPLAKLATVYDRTRRGHPPHPFSVYRLFFILQSEVLHEQRWRGLVECLLARESSRT